MSTAQVRQPVVAGQFYPGTHDECESQIGRLFSDYGGIGSDPAGVAVGGMVPHAGWVFSGQLAAEVIHSLAEGRDIDTFVVFGAAHRPANAAAGVLFGPGRWQTPMGEIEIDEQLSDTLASDDSHFATDPRAHSGEHSIEVQLPFVQHVAPKTKLVPVVVPPGRASHEVGRAVAEAAAELGREVAYLGSTDLTHYGPRYGFTPAGVGEKGLRWAREENDRRMLDLVLDMKADAVVEEAASHHNACGSGAIAAVIEACKTAGASRAVLVNHTTSEDVARARFGASQDAVGYASVLFVSDHQ